VLFPTITKAPCVLTLAPYSFLWLELQPRVGSWHDPHPACRHPDLVKVPGRMEGGQLETVESLQLH
jgi:hypothetical protein